eukprot:scaffold45883_cov70-Phaeocystis_antarctica.AAC.1
MRRGTGPIIRAVHAQAPVGAGQAARSLEAGLELPWLAQLARAHVDAWCKRARVAGRLLSAARRCIEANVSPRALVSAAEVGPMRVRALAARQWRRRALRAVRAWRAGVALGPAGLVHKLARAALIARGLLVQRLHGTRAARRWIGAARGCVEAWHGWRAIVSEAEVGLAGVRARRTRQRGASARRAERAWLAGNTRLFTLVGLVLAGRALDARAHSRHGLHRAGAALSLFGAARRRGVARVGLGALVFATQVGCLRIRALLTRQRGTGTGRAVHPLCARLALRLLLPVLKSALGARRAETHPRVSCGRAGAAGPRRGAARGRVEALLGRAALRVAAEVGTIRIRALLARQRRARAKRAEVPRLAGNARLLARIGLVRAGFALVARAHLGAGRDGTRAALGLLCAARWSKVAHVGLGALTTAGEVGGDG